MRIGMIAFTDFPEGSGPARRIHMIGKGFAGLGHEVHVIIPQRFRPGPLYQNLDGLHVHWGMESTHDNWSTLAHRLKARYRTQRLLNKIIADGMDWLLLSNPSLDGLSLFLTAKRRGVKVMATYDDIRVPPSVLTWEDSIRMLWLNWADRLIPRLVQLTIPISRYLARHLRTLAPGTPRFVLPPLVDPETFKAQPESAAVFRAKWSLGDATVVSYLGTYWKVDGVRVLLEAAKLLLKRGVKFRICISGARHEGLDCDDVVNLVSSLELANFVTVTDWLMTDEVIESMSAADILVVPKLHDIANEAGMPTKLTEYLAVGRPVVVSRVGDIPLYLTDRENVLFCEPGDPYSLAEALSMLIKDDALRSKLSYNARVASVEHFDYKKAIGNLERYLTKRAWD